MSDTLNCVFSRRKVVVMNNEYLYIDYYHFIRDNFFSFYLKYIYCRWIVVIVVVVDVCCLILSLFVKQRIVFNWKVLEISYCNLLCNQILGFCLPLSLFLSSPSLFLSLSISMENLLIEIISCSLAIFPSFRLFSTTKKWTKQL